MQAPVPATASETLAGIAAVFSTLNLAATLAALKFSYNYGRLARTVSEHGRRLKKLDGMDSDESN